MSSKPSVKRPRRILVVDDHPLMREGLGARISAQPDLEVVGEAAGVAEALKLLPTTSPDLAIVDLSLADGHGLGLIEAIRQKHPGVAILVVSAFDESLYAERCLRAGAMGYVNKRQLQENVLDAIRTVLGGQRYLSGEMTQRLLGQAVGQASHEDDDPVKRLTNRELEVFQLIGRGNTTSAIARQLHLSVHTIDTHREKIRHKLGARNSAELMQQAVTWVLENG